MKNPTDTTTDDNPAPASAEGQYLRQRLELYRWLLALAAFLIVVLLVAQCARYK